MHRKPPDLRRAPPGEGVKNKDVKCSACDMIVKNGNIGYHKKHKSWETDINMKTNAKFARLSLDLFLS